MSNSRRKIQRGRSLRLHLKFGQPSTDHTTMQKLSIFVCATVFSYLGWALGSLVGEIMTAFFVSGALSLVGVWVGWWVYRRFLI